MKIYKDGKVKDISASFVPIWVDKGWSIDKPKTAKKNPKADADSLKK